MRIEKGLWCGGIMGNRGLLTGTLAVVGLGFCLSLTSCMGLRYYDLYLEPSPVGTGGAIEKVLLVEDVRANQMLRGQGILIRKNDYLIEQPSSKSWARPADELIQDAVIQFYRNSRMFQGVVDEHYSFEADLEMRIHLHALELVEKKGAWSVHLAMDTEIRELKTEKNLFIQRIDRIFPSKRKDFAEMPIALSALLKEELMNLVERLKTSTLTDQP